MRILCVFGRHAYGQVSRGEAYEYINFIPALRALGHQVDHFDSWDRSLYEDFGALNQTLIETVQRMRPDILLTVLMAYEIWTETLDRIRANTGCRIVNWGTDDSWKYEQFTRLIAKHVDLHVTTSAAALAKAQRTGLNNIVLSQWAANHETLAEPLPSNQCRYDVSFVGAAYGNRRAWIEVIENAGMQVDCFGYGWPKGPVAAAEIPDIIHSSKLSLNFGDSGLHWAGWKLYRSRQIKARVFEVPGGGGCLLTEPAEDLSRYFDVSNEIECFDSPQNLVSKLKRLLDNPEERDRIARAGYQRTRDEHTYIRRFEEIIAFLNDIDRRDVPIPKKSFALTRAQHDSTFVLRFAKALLIHVCKLLFGPTRGPRAARRTAFELSWRFSIARTYSARGWVGRMFYHES